MSEIACVGIASVGIAGERVPYVCVYESEINISFDVNVRHPIV